MWNTTRSRRLTRSRFTRSVNGLYQQLGPHGMMARVGSPTGVVGLDFVHKLPCHDPAHLGRVRAEAERHAPLGMGHQVLIGDFAPFEEFAGDG